MVIKPGPDECHGIEKRLPSRFIFLYAWQDNPHAVNPSLAGWFQVFNPEIAHLANPSRALIHDRQEASLPGLVSSLYDFTYLLGSYEVLGQPGLYFLDLYPGYLRRGLMDMSIPMGGFA
jgi:hypothetical protein